MRAVLRLSVVMLFLLLVLQPLAGTTESQTAFVGVNVITGDSDQVRENQTVLVRGDRITEVGPAAQVTVPDGAVRIESSGKFLMPGMAEMHGHIPPPDSPDLERTLFLFVANGVTTVRGMLGFPNQIELRERVNRGDLLGPTLYLAGPGFSGNTIQSPEQAEQQVRQQKADGWELLKIFPGLTREQYDAIARTAKEVDIAFAGHVPSDVGLIHALEAGQETIDHLDGYIEYLQGDRAPVDVSALREVARRTREAGTWVVPTMVLWETIIGANDLETMMTYDGLQYTPAEQVENWSAAHRQRVGRADFDPARARQIAENRKRLLRVLHEDGVAILFGTDAPQQFSVPGFSIYREFKVMQESGMSPADIIRTATGNIGDYFKERDSFGRVAQGMRADLVLLNANPMEDLDNVRNRAGVMLRGRWLPESEIQEGLRRFQR
jgi:imidazolonepropionase-like amidohydrolase